jgi:ABC-type transport system involved in Fe-S cluster assembly, permease component
MHENVPTRSKYQYGFHDDVESLYDTGKGLTEEIVRDISARKDEPAWMLDYRLRAYEHFLERPMPTWGADLSDIDF